MPDVVPRLPSPHASWGADLRLSGLQELTVVTVAIFRDGLQVQPPTPLVEGTIHRYFRRSLLPYEEGYGREHGGPTVLQRIHPVLS